ncbi:MAG: hypothetical protein WC510_07630 [Candidatus Omnitrophota bacterium]
MAPRNKSKHLLFDPLPETIICDTTFLVFSLNKTKKDVYKNLVCRYFLKRLLKSSTKIFMSSLVFPEFWHASLKIAIGRLYDTEDEVRINQMISTQKKKCIQECCDEVIKQQRQFDKLLSKFNETENRVFIVETSKEIMMEAEKHLVKYRLLSYDAIHLATMTIRSPSKPEINNMVTLDKDIISDCNIDYNIWHKGANYSAILDYEKRLPIDELEPDSIHKPSSK